MVGAVIGPGGRSIVEIQQFSGANIQISKKGSYSPGTRNRIVTITGADREVDSYRQIKKDDKERELRET